MKNSVIIIAEIGVNHNGSILKAKKLINQIMLNFNFNHINLQKIAI